LSRQKIACVTKKREAIAIGTHHSNTRNHGCHRRPCRYPRAPRRRAQGARRAHPPRLHLQRCQGRAAQGTRGPSIPLSRKNTASRRVRYFSIFSSRIGARVAGHGRARGTKSSLRRALVARAVSLRGVPVRAILFRASRDPRQARIRTGRVPASPLFPPTSPVAFVETQTTDELLFCPTRKRAFVTSRRRRAPRDAFFDDD
jgi:hypothetical protein